MGFTSRQYIRNRLTFVAFPIDVTLHRLSNCYPFDPSAPDGIDHS